jgi:hypothetical protein
MRRFRDSNEFGPTVEAAAERLGISATAVEKDYWVSDVLRVLARDFGGDFIFKGGTSLSKAYRIVERFSEDVDVLVLAGDRGLGSTDKLMKAMGAAAAAGIGGEATSVGGSETGRHRSYEVAYPSTREPTALIRTSVLLEMGVRGGPHPHESVAVSCLLGDVLAAEHTDLGQFDDLEQFEVLVLHPGRTLLEKFVYVHAAAQRLAAAPSRQPDPRSGRHFYDIYQLLGDNRVLELLADRDQVGHVIESIEGVNRRYFPGITNAELRPPSGFADSPAFDTATDASQRLRVVYDATMPELYYGAPPLPTWEEICGRVADRHQLL